MTKIREEVLNKIRESSVKKGGSRVKNRTYKILDGDATVRLAPQQVKCLEILYAQDKNELSEQEVFDLFSVADMNTKQTAWKIFQYYRKDLCDKGFIEIVG